MKTVLAFLIASLLLPSGVRAQSSAGEFCRTHPNTDQSCHYTHVGGICCHCENGARICRELESGTDALETIMITGFGTLPDSNGQCPAGYHIRIFGVRIPMCVLN